MPTLEEELLQAAGYKGALTLEQDLLFAAREKEGLYEGFIKPTAKAIPRVTGALAGSLIAFPASGIAGLAKLITSRDLREAARTTEAIQEFPTKLLTTLEEQKALEYVGKPFEYLRKVSDYFGDKVQEGTGSPNLGALTATTFEAGVLFGLPMLARGLKGKPGKPPTTTEIAKASKAQLIEEFKTAFKAKDQAKMQAVKKTIDEMGYLSAEDIKTGTIIEVPPDSSLLPVIVDKITAEPFDIKFKYKHDLPKTTQGKKAIKLSTGELYKSKKGTHEHILKHIPKEMQKSIESLGFINEKGEYVVTESVKISPEEIRAFKYDRPNTFKATDNIKEIQKDIQKNKVIPIRRIPETDVKVTGVKATVVGGREYFGIGKEIIKEVNSVVGDILAKGDKLQALEKIGPYIQKKYGKKALTDFDKAHTELMESEIPLSNSIDYAFQYMKTEFQKTSLKLVPTEEARRPTTEYDKFADEADRFLHKRKMAEKKEMQDLIEEVRKEKANKLYEEKPLEEELFTEDVQGAMREAAAEELLHKGDKTYNAKATGELAKTKGLRFAARHKNGLELKVTDDFGNTWSFKEISQANEFIKGYTGHFAKAEKLYYETWEKIRRKSPEFDKEFAIERIGKPRKIRDTEVMRKEIDDAVPIKEGEQPPPIQLSKVKGPRLKEPKPSGLMLYFEPTKQALMDVAFRTKLPFDKFWRSTQDGMKIERQRIAHYQERVNTAYQGLKSLESGKRIKKFMETEGLREDVSFGEIKRIIKADKELTKQFDNLTEKEFNAAKQLRNIFNDAGKEFGIDIDAMITRYVHRMLARGVNTFQEAINQRIMPEDFKWAAEMERTGYLFPQEENIFRIANAYISRGARFKYLKPELDKLSELRNRAVQNKILTKAEANIIDEYITKIHGWTTGLDDLLNNTAVRIAKFMNKLPPFRWKPRFENIEYKKIVQEIEIGKTKRGKPVTTKVPRWIETGEKAPGYFETYDVLGRLLNFELNLTTAGALGLRPYAVIRNTFQSMLSMPLVGPRYWTHGVRKALTRKGMQEAKAAGILLDDYLPIGGELSVGKGVAAQAARKGLWAYRKVDSFNRTVAYHAMKRRIMNEGKRFLQEVEAAKNIAGAESAIDGFIKRSGVDWFHKAIIENEVVPLLKAKKISDLAGRMGRHMAEETQWIYRKANAPYWMQGKVGRIAGQFGVWPHWYLQYLRALMTRGSKWNRMKRMSILVGQGYLIKEIGEEVFGVDIGKWVWHHPLNWMGSPIISALSAAKDMATGGDYEQAAGESRFKSWLKLHIPFYLAVRGLVTAHEEIREEDQIKRALGFKPAEE